MQAHRKRKRLIFSGCRCRRELRALQAKFHSNPSEIEKRRQLTVDSVIEQEIELPLHQKRAFDDSDLQNVQGLSDRLPVEIAAVQGRAGLRIEHRIVGS